MPLFTSVTQVSSFTRRNGTQAGGGGAPNTDPIDGRASPSFADALNFNGTSNSLALASTPTLIASGANISISAWFRSTNSGTTRMTIFSEETNANTSLFIALNDGAAGRARAFHRDDAGTSAVLAYDGGYNDGQWHLMTYVARSNNTQSLYVDGVERATGTTTFGAYTAIVNRRIGSRFNTTENAWFAGDIGPIALHKVALTLAEHSQLYAKTKTAYTVRPRADVFAIYVPAVGQMWDQISPNLAAITNALSAASAGPSATPVQAVPDQHSIIRVGSPLITRGASAGDSDRLLRETGNVLYDPTDTGKEYKFYYTGSPDAYTGSNCGIHMAYASTLLGTWTKQGAVITSATLPSEDPYVVKDGSTYHLWCENKTGGNNLSGIAHFTSSDGITWALENGTAIDNGSGGAWDDQDVSSPIVWKEGSTWYMLYEGRKSAGQQGQVGLATASDPNGPWTKSGSNPVYTGQAATWEDQQLVPDDIGKIGSTYYMLFHANSGTYWGTGVVTSTDLITWSRPTWQQFTGRNRCYSQQFLAGDALIAIDEIDGGGNGDIYAWAVV